MKPGALLLGCLVMGAGQLAGAQTVARVHGTRFEWSPIRVLVLSDSTAGVEVYLVTDPLRSRSRIPYEFYQQAFTPGEALAWVAAAESSLADTTAFRPVTVVAHDSSLLVLTRTRVGSGQSNRIVLAYYPKPDTGDSRPLEIRLAPAQAGAFLDTLEARSRDSRYDPNAPPPDSTMLALAAIQQPPEVMTWQPLSYPESMREQGREGVVVLQVVVDTLGRVEPGTVKVVSSTSAQFTEAAQSMIRKTRFFPAHLNGRPVRVLIQVPVRFTLNHHH